MCIVHMPGFHEVWKKVSESLDPGVIDSCECWELNVAFLEK